MPFIEKKGAIVVSPFPPTEVSVKDKPSVHKSIARRTDFEPHAIMRSAARDPTAITVFFFLEKSQVVVQVVRNSLWPTTVTKCK